MKTVGVDIGGTFTDLAVYDSESGRVHVHKVPSTREEPDRAMVEGLVELCERAGLHTADIDAVFHATTVATNAVLEHDGAVVGMITTKGFRDIVHIGRHQRPQHYSVMQDIPWQVMPFVHRRHRKVVSERVVPPRGEVLVELDEQEVRAAACELRAEGVQAVAVCFLHSYLNPEHERRAAAIVREEMPDAFVTTSADIVPQFREFERFTTACMSAFVGPKTGLYLQRLAFALTGEGVRSDLHVMISSGGLASVRSAAERPVTLLLSGPAAGILGGQWAGALAGRRRLITFDMGGTSADIGIVTEQGVGEASARDTWVGGYPLLVPMLDVHTIGAGGGSIAFVDPAGAFRVGPRSAGAVPGPACYGLGGEEPTVTDAHVVLGRIDPDRFLGGQMHLDVAKAAAAFERLADRLGLGLAEAAEGAITIANANMARAIRSRTVEKGHDPREFALVAFGGAGPLHAAEVADSLDIPEVLVPPHPGITSASGLLTSDLKYDQMRTVFMVQGDVDEVRLNDALNELEDELRGRLRQDGVADDDIEVARMLDCRYAGQGYELRSTLSEGQFSADDLDRFHALHEREYGHSFKDPIEIVNARVSAIGRRPELTRYSEPTEGLDAGLVDERDSVFRVNGSLQSLTTRFFDRRALQVGQPVPGPAIVFHPDTTTLVPPKWTACAHESGNLTLRRASS
ncbi:MAG TPA: hydantoinase/oxoprolinase family protein [Solirubrobacteraceae bacterium]|nr:hydantoinase/oxoprolinase family protein [Solirubrobacteraceae bacterium]